MWRSRGIVAAVLGYVATDPNCESEVKRNDNDMKRENDYTRQRVAVECYSLTSDRQRDDVPAASQRHGASTGTAGQAAPDGDLQWADSSGHGPAYKGAPRQSARLPTAPAPQDSGTSAAAARRTLRL